MKEFTIGQNDAGQRLDRFLAKAVPLLPASLAQKYIRIKRIKCNGKRIDRDAVDRLVFLSGDLMNRLIPEIAKICGYVPGDRVTAQDVEKLAHHIPEADAFQMTEEIARRNYDGAAAKLAELLAGDAEPDPVRAVRIEVKLARHLRPHI